MSTGPQWMPLNVGDYLRDTHYLSVVEHGAYLLLIMHYWQDGGLPTDEKLIARLAHLSAEQWNESRPVLVDLFDEGWKHKRIDAELAKAAEIIDKRRSAAEQRHSKSNAHAEHVESTSSYAGVPPSPSPLVIEPPASVPEPEGARVLFEDVKEAFPRNPSSSDTEAQAAWDRTKPEDRPLILEAAKRRARWFGQDCEARGRTVEEGLRFEPHLAKWLAGKWRDSLKLQLKGENDQPIVPMTRLDRLLHARLFAACERIGRNGKRAPADQWSFPNSIVEQAKAELDQSASVH